MTRSGADRIILIVDDTPANIAIVSSLLEDTFALRVATNGERALAIAAREEPDLVLLDVVMPGMDGYEVCRRLKDNPATADIPVIFLTGQIDPEDEKRGFAAGGVDYIRKPFSAPIVLARVNTQLALQDALHQVREERATLRRVMEGMADGLIAASMDGTISYFNQRASQLLRVDLGAFVRRPIMEAVDQTQREYADPDKARAAWFKLMSEPETRPQVELALSNGSRTDLLIDSFPLTGEASPMFGVLVHDVTADREVVRTKDEMMRFLSHELRTPLSSILGFAELMLLRDFDPGQRASYLQTMLNECERLRSLINDFLDFERAASVGFQMDVRPTDVNEIIQRAVQAAGPEGAHPFRVAVSGDVPLVDANGDRVHQVLTNLISNARKYSPDGGEVLVAARRAHGFVELTVTDHGLGLPPEAEANLFQKFSRVQRPEHLAVTGTGLGLAISRQIVEAHGGRIWAKSPGLGQGTTFGFSLPCSELPQR